MTKTKRMLVSQLALVDVVIELLDARIPLSSRNPDLDALAAAKQRIIVLTKADLADPSLTRLWEKYYQKKGYSTLVSDARKNSDVTKIIAMAQNCMKEKTERRRLRGRTGAAVRAMVTGIPNVGKSTLINTLAKKAGAATGDKPGVTRGRQWINVQPGFDMLDVPGILWPKFEDQSIGLRLAVTGAISDEAVDKITLCEGLLSMLLEINPFCLEARYKIKTNAHEIPRTLLEKIGGIRGFKLKGGLVDTERAAVMVLDEFRGGKLGRITLEKPS
jgi:ribosome biogenesis GTPase A